MNFLSENFFSIEFLINRLLLLPGIIIGIAFHEFGHAFVSYKLKDPTPKLQGRVTLNPIAHIDPFGLLFIFFIGFGWGKPVQINPAFYRNKRRDSILVGIAGCTINFILGIFFIGLTAIFSKFIPGFYENKHLFNLFFLAGYINFLLMIFNLLPIPPLDGYGILENLFNIKNEKLTHFMNTKGIFVLLALVFLGATTYLVQKPAWFIVSHIWSFFLSIL